MEDLQLNDYEITFDLLSIHDNTINDPKHNWDIGEFQPQSIPTNISDQTHSQNHLLNDEDMIIKNYTDSFPSITGRNTENLV